MATDPVSDAEAEMAEKTKWGLTRSDMALVKMIAAARAIMTRLKALEDRVKALETK